MLRLTQEIEICRPYSPAICQASLFIWRFPESADMAQAYSMAALRQIPSSTNTKFNKYHEGVRAGP